MVVWSDMIDDSLILHWPNDASDFLGQLRIEQDDQEGVCNPHYGEQHHYHLQKIDIPFSTLVGRIYDVKMT